MRFQASRDSAQRYVYLMRSIYRLANASSNMPILATAILQILFVSLKGGALAFLAGIWATGGKNDFKESRSIALLHAAAFLEAHILEDDGIDFQTILPYALPSKTLISKFVKGLSSVFLASGYWRVTSYYRSIDLMLSMATATVSTLMHLSC
jgi:hypothetical protein